MSGILTRLAIAAAITAAVMLGFKYVHDAIYQQGWSARDAQMEREIFKEATRRYQTLVENIADTRALDAGTIAKLEHSNARQTSLARSLSAQLALQAATPYVYQENPSDQKPIPPLLGQSVLDDSTVRMLDAARAGLSEEREHGGAADRGDEKVTATAALAPVVTGSQFAMNDMAVVGLYHDLATRHDSLVDWVNMQCTRK